MNANASDFTPSTFRSVSEGYSQTQHQTREPSFSLSGNGLEADGGGEAAAVAGEDSYGYGNYGDDTHAETEKPKQQLGYYHFSSQLDPQLCSAPVSAIAYDDTFSAMYVASHTQQFGERSRRASMLVTHNIGTGMVHSSCAGHPECETKTLNTIYRTFYGGKSGRTNTAPIRVPPHAYQPPFGSALQPLTPHMGITSLLEASGYVVSVSPAGVRVHTQGGLCVTDHAIEGMVCGTPHPNHDHAMTHVSVGGVGIVSADTKRSASRLAPQLHCMDIYQDLRIISSRTIRPVGGLDNPTGIMAIGTSHERQSLVTGCSDGTVRFFDGSWRSRGNVEVAKVSAHTGGVTDIAVSESGTLICTTGFGAKSTAQTVPYAFPDAHLLIFDVRYLGRGGIAHPFVGLKGGPRFVRFMPPVPGQPSDRLLVASGQAGGGMQLIVPFERPDHQPESFLVPHLQSNEAITSVCLSGKHLALGTSMSSVHQYKLAGIDHPPAGADQLRAQPAGTNPDAQPFIPGGSTTPAVQVSLGIERRGAEVTKRPLEMPEFMPSPPAVSIHPSVLQSKDDSTRMGTTQRANAIFTSYIFREKPLVSKHNPPGNSKSQKDEEVLGTEPTTFGTMGEQPIVPSGSRAPIQRLVSMSIAAESDIMRIAKTSEYGLDLLGGRSGKSKTKRKPLPNPNRLIYSSLGDELFFADTRRRALDMSTTAKKTAKPRGSRRVRKFNDARHHEETFVKVAFGPGT